MSPILSPCVFDRRARPQLEAQCQRRRDVSSPRHYPDLAYSPMLCRSNDVLEELGPLMFNANQQDGMRGNTVMSAAATSVVATAQVATPQDVVRKSQLGYTGGRNKTINKAAKGMLGDGSGGNACDLAARTDHCLCAWQVPWPVSPFPRASSRERQYQGSRSSSRMQALARQVLWPSGGRFARCSSSSQRGAMRLEGDPNVLDLRNLPPPTSCFSEPEPCTGACSTSWCGSTRPRSSIISSASLPWLETNRLAMPSPTSAHGCLRRHSEMPRTARLLQVTRAL